MCSKSELQIILSEIAKTARETFGEHLDSVILYGSYARGDYTPDSDRGSLPRICGDIKSLLSKRNPNLGFNMI